MGHTDSVIICEFFVWHFCFSIKCYTRPNLFTSLTELSFVLYNVRHEKECLVASSPLCDSIPVEIKRMSHLTKHCKTRSCSPILDVHTSIRVFSDILISTWWWPTQKRAETCSCFLQQFENTVVLQRIFIHLIFTSIKKNDFHLAASREVNQSFSAPSKLCGSSERQVASDLVTRTCSISLM
jgi:hypothetical protein